MQSSACCTTGRGSGCRRVDGVTAVPSTTISPAVGAPSLTDCTGRGAGATPPCSAQPRFPASTLGRPSASPAQAEEGSAGEGGVPSGRIDCDPIPGPPPPAGACPAASAPGVLVCERRASTGPPGSSFQFSLSKSGPARACRGDRPSEGPALPPWSPPRARVCSGRAASLYQRVLLRSSPCSWLGFGKVLKSWKVGAVLPARGWAGWQPKPELGFDFIFSFSG